MGMKIRVGMAVYTTTEDITDVTDEELEEDELPFGLVDYSKKIIYLNPVETQPAARATTLWHELMHAGIFEYGHQGTKFNEEQICNIVGLLVPQLTRDNEDLMTWLKQAVST